MTKPSDHPFASARPRHNRVVIRRDKTIKKTDHGILLPETAHGVRLTGRVVAFGPGKRDQNGMLHPIDDLKVGDRVLFTRYAGTPAQDDFRTKDEQDEFTIVSDDEIVAVLDADG